MNKSRSIVMTAAIGSIAWLALPTTIQITNAADVDADLLSQAWGTLHKAIAVWDVRNSFAALEILRRTEDRCVVDFANNLEQLLQTQGSDGFREINSIKLELIENRGCNLPLISYEFSPLPLFGADQLNLQSSSEKEQWVELHSAIDAWDTATSRATLGILKQSSDSCVSSFAADLEARLIAEGDRGLWHINPIKQHYNDQSDCRLPLMNYEFSPLMFPELPAVSLEVLWADLHNAVGVWDIQTTQRKLLELRSRSVAQSSPNQPCIASFADQLETQLETTGTEGFRNINLIKITLNANEGCNLPIVPFDFASIPLGQGPNSEALLSTAWDELHEAVRVWDLQTSRGILTEMEAIPDNCTSGFASTFGRVLDVAGGEGFRQINVIKRRHNNNLRCALPLVNYAFAPTF